MEYEEQNILELVLRNIFMVWNLELIYVAWLDIVILRACWKVVIPIPIIQLNIVKIR